MSIMDKLKKNSKVKETAILADSKFFNEKDMVPTDVPPETIDFGNKPISWYV